MKPGISATVSYAPSTGPCRYGSVTPPQEQLEGQPVTGDAVRRPQHAAVEGAAVGHRSVPRRTETVRDGRRH